MKKVLFFAFVLTQFGCATILKSDRQLVDFTGGHPQDTKIQVPDGSFELKNGEGSFMISRSKNNIPIQISCAGQKNETAIVTHFDPLAGVFGNLIFGGIIGLAIDASGNKAYDPPRKFDLKPFCGAQDNAAPIAVEPTPKSNREPAAYTRTPIRADQY